MHPLSDEVLAIYTEMARLFEKIGEVQRSVDVYTALKGNISKWMEAQGHEEDMRAQRTRLLAKAVTYSTKLGQLYSSEYIGDRENAEKSLVWAVETALREKQRRQTEGVRPGEGDWIDDDQMGSQLEGLSIASRFAPKPALTFQQLLDTPTRRKTTTSSPRNSSSKRSWSSRARTATASSS